MNIILVFSQMKWIQSCFISQLVAVYVGWFSRIWRAQVSTPTHICSCTCKRAPNNLLAWWMSYSDWGANDRCVFLLLIKFDLEVLPRLRRDKLWDSVMRTGSVTVGGVMGVIGVHSPGRSNGLLINLKSLLVSRSGNEREEHILARRGVAPCCNRS